MQTIPKRIVVDLIGKFFIYLPYHIKKKDVPVDRHILAILLLQMRLPHIHTFVIVLLVKITQCVVGHDSFNSIRYYLL